MEGGIDFCEKYTSESTHADQICERCFNSYYLENNLCKKSDPVEFCEKTHPTVNKACLTCEFDK